MSASHGLEECKHLQPWPVLQAVSAAQSMEVQLESVALSAHAEQAVQVPMEAALQAEVEVPMEAAMEAEADPHPLVPSKVPRLSVVSSTASEAQDLSVGSSTACAAPLQIQLEML